jgi:site-specific DNA-methyltransferase (adenine-specific)
MGAYVGFGGKRFVVDDTEESPSYDDSFDDFLGFLLPRIEAALPLLTDDGSLMVHLDYREVHYAKVALDKLLGRDHFINEIIWAYDFGGRSKTFWSRKHDTILWYVKDPKNYVFNYDEIDRIPYLAPSLVGDEKAARGKTPTDVHWHTIVPTNGKERLNYPTQKPLGLLNRFIKVHSKPGDTVLDFFAGSGTTGQAAANNGREFILIDSSQDAMDVMTKRLSKFKPEIKP